MSSPELVEPVRLDSLLAGALPETQGEARLQGLARELRSLSLGAPSSLRERVNVVAAGPQRTPILRRRRLLVALAAASVAVVVGTAAALRFATHESSRQGSAQLVRDAASEAQPPFDALRRPYASQARPPLAENLSGLSAGRAQNIDMWIDLRVKNADDVSSASQEAAQITRELGGVIASSSVDTQGARGRAQLALRIPVARIDDAVLRLSQLGIVTGQRVNTEDLEAPLDRDVRRIERLRSEIRIELARLGSGQLDAAQELQSRIRLEHLRRDLRDAKRDRATIARQTAMADLTLRLATPTAGAVEKDESGVSGAAHRAVDFLSGAGSVAVFLAVVLSPLLLLVVLAWLILRAHARRIESELLDETRPGAASAQKPSP
jgi:hypothetical protein